MREFRVACALLDTHDLREGVRAAIIDKDKRPKWSPATLAEVERCDDRGDSGRTGGPNRPHSRTEEPSVANSTGASQA